MKKKVIFEFGTHIRLFLRVLVEVGVIICLFPKTFVDDVDSICITCYYWVCEQAES